MCGLVGAAGDLGYADEKRIKFLLSVDWWRGKDSVGLASVEDKEISLFKSVANPFEVFDNKHFDKVCNGSSAEVFIGHNRAATMGAVSHANAHPFVHENWVGAHNGTLTKSSWKDLEKMGGAETGTDSEALIRAIVEKGFDEAIGVAAEGAWALTMCNAEKNLLYFLCNSERPLWYGFGLSYSKKPDRIYWASEAWMLRAMGSFTNLDWWADKKGYSFFPVLDDTLLELDIDDLKEGQPSFEEKELEGRPTPTSNFTLGYTGATEVTTTQTSSGKGTKKARTWVDAKEKSLPEWYTTFGDIAEIYGIPYLGHTCKFCEDDIDFSSGGVAYYSNMCIFLCPMCNSEAKQFTGKIKPNFVVHENSSAYLSPDKPFEVSDLKGLVDVNLVN